MSWLRLRRVTLVDSAQVFRLRGNGEVECWGFDVVVAAARLPEIAAGDVLALLDTGAYQDAGACNFNAMPRPATVLVRGRDADVIKRAETVAEVFRRDVVPVRLGEVDNLRASHEAMPG
jgi:hypothetical protein